MEKQDKVLIFGHKKPDTDSITGAISLEYLKKQLGVNAQARVLGEPNNETKFALDYFKVASPKYLNDVKIKIFDLSFLKNYSAKITDSMYYGFNLMNEHVLGTLPIIDNKNKLLAIVSLKDIAKYQFNGEASKLRTSYKNIIETLNAKEILKFKEEFDGNIIAASYSTASFLNDINLTKNDILIVGDRKRIINYAIECGIQLLILTGNKKLDSSVLENAKQNKVSVIYTNQDTFHTSRTIGMTNYLENVILNQNIVTVKNNEDINDFIDLTKKFKYSNYPVIEENNNYVGLIRLSDITTIKKKKVILVDHNESIQSVDGLDEAEIIEIVDHHKLGTPNTSMPISFRNMPVGSSNTIIYMLYQENRIDIPVHIAGLMLSGIISDTLLFKSPTTTELDIKAGHELSRLAGVNLEEYGMEMLKAGSSLKGKTKEEIIYYDFKNFTINGKKVGIGQINTLNINEIMKDKDEYISLINEIAKNNDYYIISLFATDIIKNGSYMFYNDSAHDILDNCFDIQDIEQGYYLDGVISRKKQIIPNIMNTLEKK